MLSADDGLVISAEMIDSITNQNNMEEEDINKTDLEIFTPSSKQALDAIRLVTTYFCCSDKNVSIQQVLNIENKTEDIFYRSQMLTNKLF